MKKLLMIIAVAVGMTVSAQNYNNAWSTRDKITYSYVGAGFDLRNSIIGSKPTGNSAALDFTVKTGIVSNNVEVGVFYESFKKIKFQSYGVNVNYVFPVLEKTDVSVGIEAGSIIRTGNSNFLMAGGNVELRHNFGRFVVGFQGNGRIRSDIWYKNQPMPIVYSGFVNLYYKLKQSNNKRNY